MIVYGRRLCLDISILMELQIRKIGYIHEVCEMVLFDPLFIVLTL